MNPITNNCALQPIKADMVAVLPWLRRSAATLLIAIAAIVVAALPMLGTELQFDRAAIAAGEIWRLATCHLTHWNSEHLVWDLSMFVVLGIVCECRNPRAMQWCLVTAATAVTCFVWFACPAIREYRGLSGIDTALFTLLAIDLLHESWRSDNRPLAIAAGGLLIGFVAKVTYEATTGQTYFVDQAAAGFTPLVWDHITAGLVGAAFALGNLRHAVSVNQPCDGQT